VPKKIYNITTKYNSEHLFDIVADVESYPEFLPWVVASRILEREGDVIIAELKVKYKLFRSSYVSRVKLIPKQEIIVELVDGPFTHLNNYWKFKGNNVEFRLDFEFKSSLFNDLISSEFEHYASKMMDAFNKRAVALNPS
jgi:coenzyme Q-binding protein COQ10